ncbi:DUF805 domain-containing protein [Curtobacterium sp. Leaf183]|uniref:DUF805 domain-containing protein n=1 Tax=Curtobacterium sp. Leaf183 TaxID=1736291 RepID=UPI0009E8B54D|nr:DUF805 domain-containing protein [Curtobacterium sp. Leaf183]
MTDQYPPQNPYGQQPGGQPNPYGQPNQYGQQPGPGHAPQYGGSAPVGPDGAPPLWAPWYGISFPKAAARFWKKYARFDGRASRSEYWWWVLANAIVLFVIYGLLLAIVIGTGTGSASSSATGVQASTSSTSPLIALPVILGALWGLATIVPSLALGWRRLHDANLPGALWIIAVFVGIVGIVFALLPSNPEGQRFDEPGRG